MHLHIFFKEKNQGDSTDFQCCQNCAIFEEVVDKFGRSVNNQIGIIQLFGPNFTKFCPTTDRIYNFVRYQKVRVYSANLPSVIP